MSAVPPPNTLRLVRIYLPYVTICVLAWACYSLWGWGNGKQETIDTLRDRRTQDKQELADFWREAYIVTHKDLQGNGNRDDSSDAAAR